VSRDMKESHGENEDLPVITAFMKELASEPLGGSPPQATFIWWKAQLGRRWDAEHRAAAPVRLDECICAGLAALAGIGLAAWRATSPPIATPLVGALSIAGVLILLTSAMFVAGDVINNRHLGRKGPS
jgi:hypothetical protein